MKITDEMVCAAIHAGDFTKSDAVRRRVRVALEAALSAQPSIDQEPYMWVKEHPAWFDASQGIGEPESAEFLDEPKPGAFPLYRHPVPALSAAPQPVAVPDGWKLVPIEPTSIMIEMAQLTHTSDLCEADVEDIYQTMLAASPAAPSDQAHEDKCPVCDVAFRQDDICASDIEMGTCHAECLEGSPVVDLNTGEPIEGPAATFTYGDE